MFWAVVIGAVCGALAGALASLIVRDASERRGLHLAVMVGFFVMLNGAARSTVLPEIRAWQARSAAQELMSENRALELLVREHPELGDQFEGMLVRVVSSGASRDEARKQGMEWGRSTLAPYLERYSRRASEESLSSYTETMIEVLETMGSRDPDACYGILFGAGPLTSPTDAQGHRLSDAMAAVIESALEDPQREVAPGEGDRLIEDLVARLQGRHGDAFVEELQLLARPMDRDVDRAVVCATTLEMYREVMRMPDGRRGRTLRHLLGSEGA
jgi:hypothetical protein